MAGRWHVAPALAILIGQVNGIAPNRSKRSDGTIGDAAHQARRSDHNPDADDRSVNGADFTHDPRGGFDARQFAEQLASSGDPRLEYVIFARRIWSRARAHEGWRPYTGTNPHTTHAHVSVSHVPRLEDDAQAWRLPMFGNTEAAGRPRIVTEEHPMTKNSTIVYIRRPDGLISRVYTESGLVTHLTADEWHLDFVLAALDGRKLVAQDVTHEQFTLLIKGCLDIKAINKAAGVDPARAQAV